MDWIPRKQTLQDSHMTGTHGMVNIASIISKSTSSARRLCQGQGQWLLISSTYKQHAVLTLLSSYQQQQHVGNRDAVM